MAKSQKSTAPLVPQVAYEEAKRRLLRDSQRLLRIIEREKTKNAPPVDSVVLLVETIPTEESEAVEELGCTKSKG